ncbi:MAG: LLM class flavin-dependent oxidoreductase [Solirubrobacterales bacterium]|nr:LLM class flavin-dependent oxidoreductase [Solirubrobacterales bacterium]
MKLAESLGYHSAFVTHIAGRESLTVVAAYALATERIRVGTGAVPIYTRTPATMAQTAATIDELSGGRLTLGLGVSHRAVVEVDTARPSTVQAVRAELHPRRRDPLRTRGARAPARTGMRMGVERYRGAAVTLPCAGPISRTDFEATLRAAAPAR